MPAPSPFSLTVCSLAAILACYSGRDLIDATRDKLANEYRQSASEFRWTLKSLPGEILSAGDELVSIWHRASTSVAVEAHYLKEKFDAEMAAGKSTKP